MKQIESGGISDCLADFFSRFGKSDELMEFAKVSKITVRRWRVDKIMPYGETLMRVGVFLELAGYRISELRETSHELYEIVKCMALDIVAPSAVSQELNMDPRRVYEYLRGAAMPSNERNAAFAAIVSAHKEALEAAWSQKRLALKPLSIDQASAQLETTNGSPDALIVNFATACAKVRELGKILLDGPVETRFAMRRKMCEGREPDLNCTWETLNLLLRERTKQ